jgi:outer membrane lipoprotein-sorting protein
VKFWSAFRPVERWVIAAALSVAVASAWPAKGQTAPSLDALFESFRSVSGMELRFREEKRIALMRVPSVSEGTLHYARPGRLVRRVTSPSPVVVLIDGDELAMSEGGRTTRIDLASQPLVRSFVDTFSQLLAGDRALLERTYRVTYAPGEAGRWTLTLAPKSAPLDRFLREIRFEGQGVALERMIMSEVNGDITTTTFSNVDTRRRFSAEEATRIFSLGTGS